MVILAARPQVKGAAAALRDVEPPDVGIKSALARDIR